MLFLFKEMNCVVDENFVLLVITNIIFVADEEQMHVYCH